MQEIGTDPRTYLLNKRALSRLQWIKSYSATKFELTDKDLTDD